MGQRGSWIDVPRVELPPPSGEPGGARSLGLRALVSVGLLAGVFALVLAVLAVGVGLNVLLLRAGRISGPLLIGTLAVMVAIGRALLAAVKSPPEPPDEVEVPADAEPLLYDEIRRLAAEVGTHPPDRIVLVPQVNAYVREFGPMLGLVSGSRTMGIGTPLLDVLTVSELRGVLAHELGHLAGGDTRLGPLAYRTEQVLAVLVTRLPGSVAPRVLGWYWGVQHRVSAAVRRGQELVADRAAVRAAGRQAAADALRKVEVAAIGQDVLHRAYLEPLLVSGHRPADLRAGLRALLEARARSLSEHVDEAVVGDDPYASHPPTAERIRRVAALPETHTGGVDDRPASVLLTDADRWIKAVDDRWLALVTGGADLPESNWAEWPLLVVAGERAARSSVVDTTLSELGLPVGLPGVRAAFEGDRQRELAAGLVRAGWRTGTADERDQVLKAAIEATAATAAVGGGRYVWELSWSGPVALRSTHGEFVALSELASRAVEGDWSRLSELGLAASARTAGAGPDLVPGAMAEERTTSVLPDPPQPPFSRSGEGAWQAQLPGAIGKKVHIRLDPTSLELNGHPFAFEEIDHVTIGFGDPDSSGVSATLALTDHRGRSTKVKASSATARGGQPIAAAIGHLWRVLQAEVAPRRTDEVMRAIAEGGSVEVGGLLMDQAGARVASRKGSRTVPWHDLGDPLASDRHVVIPIRSGKPITLKLDRPDTYLLFAAVPELRARFGA